MGQILKGKCTNCKYSVDVIFGGSRLSYEENCPVPALNLDTNEIESVNYIIHKNNINFLFYNNNKLKGLNDNKLVYRVFDLELNPENNFCPKCKKLSLEFISNIMTD